MTVEPLRAFLLSIIALIAGCIPILSTDTPDPDPPTVECFDLELVDLQVLAAAGHPIIPGPPGHWSIDGHIVADFDGTVVHPIHACTDDHELVELLYATVAIGQAILELELRDAVPYTGGPR